MVQDTVLVVGIGNTLMGDEGIGVHALEYLRRTTHPASGLNCLDGGTYSFELLNPITRSHRFIALDAARLEAPPGTIRILEGEEMDLFLRASGRSAHEVGLADLLDMARMLDQLPPRRALVAIGMEHPRWGGQPTPALLDSLPRVAHAVQTLVERWRAPATTPSAGGSP